MKLFDRDPSFRSEHVVLRAPMVALSNPDPVLNFPSATSLSSRVFVRNALQKELAAQMVLNWRSPSGTGTVTAAPLLLKSGETRQIDLGQLGLPAEANWAGVSLEYDGKSGDLVAVSASYDETGRYGLQSPFSDTRASGFKGGQWHVDSTRNTLITMGYGGQQPQKATLILYYPGGKYELPPRPLKTNEQVWIDVGKIIREQSPDKDGKTIPPNTVSGSYELLQLDSGMGELFEGKLIIDKTFGHATYGCGMCCAPVGAWLDDLFLVPGDNIPDTIFVENGCTGYVSTFTPGSTWNSSATGVATVSGSGMVNGVSVGTSDIATTIHTRIYYTYEPQPGQHITCPSDNLGPAGAANVISLSQTPSSLNMSNGDTNKTIAVTVRPNGATASNLVFTTSLQSNPNSGSQASLSIPGASSISGTQNFTISVSGTNSPSGIFGVYSCASGACSTTTTIKIPPQILIQMIEAEAGGTNSTAMMANGDVARNRIGSSLFNPPYNTYQNTIPGQFVTSSTTIGIQPELDSAVSVFTSTGGNFCNALAFWTPTAGQWTTVQNAINSPTTTFPSNTGAPTFSSVWPTSQQQILYVSSVGTQGNGAPNFLYLAQRSSSQPAAVSVSCTP